MNLYRLHSKTFSVACERPAHGYTCTSPRMAQPVLRAIYAAMELDMDREHFVVLVLDAKGRVIGHKLLSSGTETACLVTPAMVFRAALVLGGVSVLTCHNHPSGDPAPSREDEQLTARLRSSGEALSLPLADHIILGNDDSSYSFRVDQGWDRRGN